MVGDDWFILNKASISRKQFILWHDLFYNYMKPEEILLKSIKQFDKAAIEIDGFEEDFGSDCLHVYYIRHDGPKR